MSGRKVLVRKVLGGRKVLVRTVLGGRKVLVRTVLGGRAVLMRCRAPARPSSPASRTSARRAARRPTRRELAQLDPAGRCGGPARRLPGEPAVSWPVARSDQHRRAGLRRQRRAEPGRGRGRARAVARHACVRDAHCSARWACSGPPRKPDAGPADRPGGSPPLSGCEGRRERHAGGRPRHRRPVPGCQPAPGRRARAATPGRGPRPWPARRWWWRPRAQGMT